MTEKKVTILYNLKDKASKGIKSITKRIADLGKKAIGIKTVTAAFTALTAAVVLSIKAFIEHRKVVNQTEATLKSTGYQAGLTTKEITKMSRALSDGTNYTRDAAQSAANLLLTFTRISKDVFPDTLKIVMDVSTAMGQDMKSSAIQLGKALNDPIKGVSALADVGVTFTEEQKKTIKTLTEENRVLDAQRLILKELATEFGGSAQAQADGYTQVRKSSENLAQSIGQKLNPAFERLAFLLSDVIISIDNFTKGTKSAGDLIGKIAGRVAQFSLGLTIVISALSSMFLAVSAGGALAIAKIISLTSGVAVGIGLMIGSFTKLGKVYDVFFANLNSAIYKSIGWFKKFAMLVSKTYRQYVKEKEEADRKIIESEGKAQKVRLKALKATLSNYRKNLSQQAGHKKEHLEKLLRLETAVDNIIKQKATYSAKKFNDLYEALQARKAKIVKDAEAAIQKTQSTTFEKLLDNINDEESSHKTAVNNMKEKVKEFYKLLKNNNIDYTTLSKDELREQWEDFSDNYDDRKNKSQNFFDYLKDKNVDLSTITVDELKNQYSSFSNHFDEKLTPKADGFFTHLKNVYGNDLTNFNGNLSSEYAAYETFVTDHGGLVDDFEGYLKGKYGDDLTNFTGTLSDEYKAFEAHLNSIKDLGISFGKSLAEGDFTGAIKDAASSIVESVFFDKEGSIQSGIFNSLQGILGADAAAFASGLLGGAVGQGVLNIVSAILGANPHKTVAEYAADKFDEMVERTNRALEDIGREKEAADYSIDILNELKNQGKKTLDNAEIAKGIAVVLETSPSDLLGRNITDIISDVYRKQQKLEKDEFSTYTKEISDMTSSIAKLKKEVDIYQGIVKEKGATVDISKAFEENFMLKSKQKELAAAELALQNFYKENQNEFLEYLKDYNRIQGDLFDLYKEDTTVDTIFTPQPEIGEKDTITAQAVTPFFNYNIPDISTESYDKGSDVSMKEVLMVDIDGSTLAKAIWKKQKDMLRNGEIQQ